MKSLIKRISYKFLVISMITVVLSFFSVSSVSEAKLKLEDGSFYYSGTQEGTYVVEKSLWSNVLAALGQIANYLLGIMILPIKGVIVGWTEIFEIILTALLGFETDFKGFISDALAGMDSYTQDIVNVEKIIFNKVDILNANIFKKLPSSSSTTMKKNQRKVVKIIKNSVAKWYYVMRLIVIAFMLVLLIFIGIKMAISTIASEKAVYKQMLIDWVAGMVLVFSIHYIMIAILSINDTIVEALSPMSEEKETIQEEYEYGDEKNQKTSSEIETTLYETARTRAYSMKLTDGFTGMIIYCVLVYYAWKFALIYLRRVINIMILTLVAPIISASYAFNKVLTGKAKVFSTWLSEYIMNVVIQVVHAIVYVVFVSTALQLSLVSITGTVLAFVLLNFMAKADKLIRKLFKLSGGKGSLAGDMADRTNMKQVRNDVKSLQNAVVGGAVAKTAMKATYGAMTKPIKAVGLEALSAGVAAYKNRESTKKKEATAEREKLENSTAEAGEYLEENAEARRKTEEIEELKKRKEELLAERGYYYHQLDDDNVKKTQKEIVDIDKKIKKKEEEIKKALLTEQVSSGGSIFGTIKGNIKYALDELVEPDKKTGKYVSKKVKVLREGGVHNAFWRKKIDSKGLRFKQNMKLSKLFGLESGEVKVLKSEIDFWKNRVIALASAVTSVPLLVVNPLIGMAALGNATLTHLDVRTRRRIYKSRVANLQNKSYTFKGFGAGAIQKLSRPETYHMLEMDKLEMLKHKRVRKEVKDLVKWANAQEIRESKIVKDAENLENQYNSEMHDYESNIKKEVSQKEVEDLAFEEKVRQEDIAHVGDGICMQIEQNTAMKKLMDNVEKIESQEDLSSSDKVNLIQKEMDQQKNTIIKEAITSLCVQNGVTDISKVQVSDAEIIQVNEKILGTLEKNGIVKKGDIDLEKSNINDETISNVYSDLVSDSENTNKELQEKIISNSILSYMEQNGIKDKNKLNTEEALDGIYNSVAIKLMPKSSKQSYNVIKKLTGNSEIDKEFELPEEVKQTVQENIKKVKKIKKEDLQISDNLKEQLVQREVNRRTNQTKNKLEKAVYTEDSKELTTEELNMLFILTDLENKNAKLDQVGLTIDKQKSEKTDKKLKYYQMNDGSKNYDSSKDGSVKYDQSKDGSVRINISKEQMLKEQREKRELEGKIYGSAVDIIELINNNRRK